MESPDIRILAGLAGGGEIGGDSGARIKKELDSIANAYNQQGGLRLSVNIDQSSLSSLSKQIDVLKTQLSSLQSGAKSIKTAFGSIGTDSKEVNIYDSSGAVISTVSKYGTSAKRLSKNIAEVRSQLDILQARYSNILGNNEKLYQQYSSILSNLDNVGTQSGLTKIKDDVSKLKKSIALEIILNKNAIAAERFQQKIAATRANAELLSLKFPKMDSNSTFKAQFDDIISSINKASSSSELEIINGRIVTLRKNMIAAGLDGKNAFSTMSAAVQKFSQYVGASTIVLSLLGGFRDIINNVIALDASLVEFNKVADLTSEELKSVTAQAYDLGSEIGRTGKDVIDAATEFRRAGYDLNSSLNMSEAALVMTNVGDAIKDTADAASILIAVLRGFNMADSQAMDVVDKINEVSNTAPIGFENIAEGLTRLSGTMYQNGTSIEQTIGLITGGFAQLRNVEKVSAGLLQISQRLRGIDEDGQAIEGLAPKLAGAFGEVGVSILDQEGNLRSTFDILRDYAGVYDSLSDVQRQYLNELAAGNRQVTVLNAIMQQWDDVEKAINSATNATGSAEKENAIFMDSIQGKVNEFESSWQRLSNTAVDNDLIKGIVSLGTVGVNSLETLISKFGALSTVAGGAGIASLVKSIASNKKDLKSIAVILDSFNVDSKSGKGSAIQNLVSGLSNLSNAQQKATLNASGFNKELKNQVSEILNLVKAGDLITKNNFDQITSTVSLTNSQKESLATLFKQNSIGLEGLYVRKQNIALIRDEINNMKDLDNATKKILSTSLAQVEASNSSTLSLKSSVAAMGSLVKQNLIAIGVIAALTLAYKLIDAELRKVEISAENTREAFQELDNIGTEYNSLQTEIENVSNRMEELYVLQNSSSWNETLKEELRQLEVQNETLRTQIDLLKEKKKEQSNIGREALENEINTTLNDSFIADLNTSGYGREMGDTRTRYTQEEYTKEALKIIEQLNIKREAGLSLTEKEQKVLDNIISKLLEYSNKYSEWASQYSSLGTMEDLAYAEYYTSLSNAILDAVSSSNDFSRSTLTNAKLIKDAFISGKEIGQFRDELSKITMQDFFANQSTDAYEYIKMFAEINNISFVDVVAELERLGAFTESSSEKVVNLSDSISSALDSIENETAFVSDILEYGLDNGLTESQITSLLDLFPELTDELAAYRDGLITTTELQKKLQDAFDAYKLRELDDAFEELRSAVDEYGADSYFAVQAVQNMLGVIPGLSSALASNSEHFDLVKLASLDSRDGILEAALAMVQSAKAAAQLDLSSAVDQFLQMGTAAQIAAGGLAAFTAAERGELSSLEEVEAEIEKALNSSIGGSGGSRGVRSGGSSVDKHLEAYKEAVAEIQHYRNMDYISEAEYYRRLEQLANQYLRGRSKYIDEYRSVLEELWAYQKRLYEEERDAQIEVAEAAADARKEAAEEQYEAEKEALDKRIDALEDEKDAYKDLIDQRKKLLEDQSSERDHNQKVDELNSDIASIQAELNALALDDSAKANARRIELQEELNQKQQELENEQYDWSVEKQEDALDAEYDRFEKLIDDQIKLINNQLDQLKKSYDATVASIDSALQHSISSIEAQFNALINNAQNAANQISAILSNINISVSGGISQMQGALGGAGFNLGNYGPGKDGVDGIMGTMTTKALQEYLNQLPSTSGTLKVDGIIGSKTRAAIQAAISAGYLHSSFATLHSGGVVGDKSTYGNPLEHIIPLKKNEVLAKLLDGEVVLNVSQQDMLRNLLTSSIVGVQSATARAALASNTSNNSIVINNVFEGPVDNDALYRLEEWSRKFKKDIQDGVFSTINKHSKFSGGIFNKL